MKSICVFCGSSPSHSPAIMAATVELGNLIVKEGITLVYGGAKVGLMGTLANATLAAGGKVIGVLPHFLGGKELAHDGLTELIRVPSMHARKTKMFELSEGFIALPGGFGTLEEVSEILTWRQLGIHPHPVGFLNVDGFYDPLLQQFKNMKSENLLRPEFFDMVLKSESVTDLLQQMQNYIAPQIPNLLLPKNT